MTALNVLAIDPAARTGWAWSDSIRRHSGFWVLRPRHLVEDLESHIVAVLERFPTDVLAYEAATFGSHNPHTQLRHNELAGVIQLCAARADLRCWDFNPGTWKLRALGRGRLGKGARVKLEVIRLLKLHHGIEVSDTDEADAIGILLAALMGPPPLPKKKERKRIEKAARKKQRTFFKV